MSAPRDQPSKASRAWKTGRWIVGVTLLLVAFGLVVLTSLREPVYHGQALSLWLENYYKDPGIGDYQAANTAVRAIGSNAIPVLLRMVAAEEPGFQEKLKQWITKVPGLRMKWARPEALRIRAVHAFRALGAEGRAAIPELKELLFDPGTAQYAAKCLAVMGDDTVPLLSSALTNKDEKIRIAAADATRLMSDSGKITVVPGLLPFLSDPSPDVRSTAAWSLGSNAKAADVVVPALMRLFSDSNSTVQCNAIAGVGEFENSVARRRCS